MDWKKHVRKVNGEPCSIDDLIALYNWTTDTAESKNLQAEETGVLFMDDAGTVALHQSTITKPDGTEPSTTVKNNMQTSYTQLLTGHGLEEFASDAKLPEPTPPVPPVESFDAVTAPTADA